MQREIDVFLDRETVKNAVLLSFPTISRMQRRGMFPKFEKISAGRVGLRRSTLDEFLAGRREWREPEAADAA